MNEFERIARIARILGAPDAFKKGPGRVSLGIGDDAAALQIKGDTVLSVDTAVEGVHFRSDWLDWSTIGGRAFHAAVSDLAAMGVPPAGALLSLILPQTMHEDALDALVQGVADAARATGCPVVGGNLSAGRELSITTTVVGDGHGGIRERCGARAGDEIYVSGYPGAAGLGLRSFMTGRSDAISEAVRMRFARPTARVALGQAVRPHVTAMIDLSDGLAQDLAHLLRASDHGATLHVDALPRIDHFDTLCDAFGIRPYEALLGGGEDYELLFTAPPGALTLDAIAVDSQPITCIGRIEAEPGLRIRDAQGHEVPPPKGFLHFGGPS